MRSEVAIVIAGMAIIMVLTRTGGYWLVGRLAPTPRVTRIIEQLGGVTLVALTAPAVVNAGTPGIIAAAVAALTAWRTGNLLVAMLLGMGVIHILRQVLT
ncbi:MAG: AzlD domain-containing protein [Thermomicrobiales bacterium]|nr:AzlD domain-containing protein [Thermomicrobiales bacterium]MCA9880510.1 AzlD domain-containing protein [Thermomicrobiales bacterium]